MTAPLPMPGRPLIGGGQEGEGHLRLAPASLLPCLRLYFPQMDRRQVFRIAPAHKQRAGPGDTRVLYLSPARALRRPGCENEGAGNSWELGTAHGVGSVAPVAAGLFGPPHGAAPRSPELQLLSGALDYMALQHSSPPLSLGSSAVPVLCHRLSNVLRRHPPGEERPAQRSACNLLFAPLSPPQGLPGAFPTFPTFSKPQEPCALPPQAAPALLAALLLAACLPAPAAAGWGFTRRILQEETTEGPSVGSTVSPILWLCLRRAYLRRCAFFFQWGARPPNSAWHVLQHGCPPAQSCCIQATNASQRAFGCMQAAVVTAAAAEPVVVGAAALATSAQSQVDTNVDKSANQVVGGVPTARLSVI